mmetsp:Transcript_8740/g.26960  ORF Transcript_8740/g.26960 Transcript_8740/m.26960 type:complete len:293 (+) Transcript_8740:59-937(+)
MQQRALQHSRVVSHAGLLDVPRVLRDGARQTETVAGKVGHLRLPTGPLHLEFPPDPLPEKYQSNRKQPPEEAVCEFRKQDAGHGKPQGSPEAHDAQHVQVVGPTHARATARTDADARVRAHAQEQARAPMPEVGATLGVVHLWCHPHDLYVEVSHEGDQDELHQNAHQDESKDVCGALPVHAHPCSGPGHLLCGKGTATLVVVQQHPQPGALLAGLLCNAHIAACLSKWRCQLHQQLRLRGRNALQQATVLGDRCVASFQVAWARLVREAAHTEKRAKLEEDTSADTGPHAE